MGVIIKKENSDLIFKYSINDKPYTISLRKNSSDSSVFLQILIYNGYKIITEFFRMNKIIPETIVDAGANIGLTSVLLKAYFPNAAIIALEPLDSNFERLNNIIKTNNLENITILKKGLWGRSTYLSPDTSFRDGQEWSFRLIETSDDTKSSFEVVSIPDIINQFNIEVIDFLKIDIEGGEVSVFNSESNLDWLKKVKVLAIEIHDEFDCRSDIENILLKFEFILYQSGELTIGLNKKLIF
jgi:FkbM family methyltransferase